MASIMVLRPKIKVRVSWWPWQGRASYAHLAEEAIFCVLSSLSTMASDQDWN